MVKKVRIFYHLIYERPPEKSYLKRRANFHNETLLTVTFPSIHLTMLPPDWKVKAIESTLVPNSWEITDLATGLAKDHLDLIAKKLNFSLRHFKPFQKVWGGFDPKSGQTTGLPLYLQNGSADLIRDYS